MREKGSTYGIIKNKYNFQQKNPNGDVRIDRKLLKEILKQYERGSVLFSDAVNFKDRTASMNNN